MMRDLRCQLKHAVQYRLEIGGVAVSQGGFELNFFRGANRGLVQPMTEAAYHFHDANLPGRGKDNVDQDLALDLKLSPLISVNRTGLECDLGRQGFDDGFGGLGFGLSDDDVGVSEAALPNRTARTGNRAGTVAGGDTAAKASARDHPARAMRSAGAVAIAWTVRHVIRARLSDRNRTAVIVRRGHAVRITEATGLYFLRRGRHGWRSRTSVGEHIRFDRRPGDQRLHVRQKFFLGSQRYLGRLLGNWLLRLDQFGGNAQSFGPRRYRLGNLWNRKILDRRRSLR